MARLECEKGEVMAVGTGMGRSGIEEARVFAANGGAT